MVSPTATFIIWEKKAWVSLTYLREKDGQKKRYTSEAKEKVPRSNRPIGTSTGGSGAPLEDGLQDSRVVIRLDTVPEVKDLAVVRRGRGRHGPLAVEQGDLLRVLVLGLITEKHEQLH